MGVLIRVVHDWWIHGEEAGAVNRSCGDVTTDGGSFQRDIF